MRSLRLLLAAALVSATPAPVGATVTTSVRTVSYSPAGDTSTFVVTYPFVSRDQLLVVKTLESTGTAVSPFTRGVHYNVFIPIGSSNGYVTTTSPVTTAYTVTISRVTAQTQTTQFRSQGRYSAASHENAFDKLTMLIQETRAAAGTSGDTAVETHIGNADDHEQYAILNGRAGGQHLKGGTASAENLTLSSTAHGTKGFVYVGGEAVPGVTVDEDQGFVGINTLAPGSELEITGSVIIASGNLAVTGPNYISSGNGSGGNLVLKTTGNATKGKILMGSAGTELVLDDVNNRIGINTASPATPLHVVGDSYLVGDVTIGLAGVASIFIEPDLTTGLITDLKAETDEVNGEFKVLLAPTDGLYDNATGVGMYSDLHSYKPNYIELYGEYVGFSDDPNTDTHSSITETAVFFDGTLLSQHFIDEIASAKTFTLAECGSHFTSSNVAVDTVVTLPELTGADNDIGCMITAINGITSGTRSLTLAPHINDPIFGSCVGVTGAGAATVAESSGLAGEAWENTLATTNKGDYSTLIADPKGSGWWIVSCMGVWVTIP